VPLDVGPLKLFLPQQMVCSWPLLQEAHHLPEKILFVSAPLESADLLLLPFMRSITTTLPWSICFAHHTWAYKSSLLDGLDMIGASNHQMRLRLIPKEANNNTCTASHWYQVLQKAFLCVPSLCQPDMDDDTTKQRAMVHNWAARLDGKSLISEARTLSLVGDTHLQHWEHKAI
jgi:muramidase (phage lysozyme)